MQSLNPKNRSWYTYGPHNNYGYASYGYDFDKEPVYIHDELTDKIMRDYDKDPRRPFVQKKFYKNPVNVDMVNYIKFLHDWIKLKAAIQRDGEFQPGPNGENDWAKLWDALEREEQAIRDSGYTGPYVWLEAYNNLDKILLREDLLWFKELVFPPVHAQE